MYAMRGSQHTEIELLVSRRATCLLKKGRKDYKGGHWDKALKSYVDAHKWYKELEGVAGKHVAECLYEQGRCQIRRGEYSSAVLLTQRACEMAKHVSIARLVQVKFACAAAEACGSKQLYQRARDHLKMAYHLLLKENPNRLQALGCQINWARVSIELKEVDQAECELRAAYVELLSQGKRAATLRAQALHELGRIHAYRKCWADAALNFRGAAEWLKIANLTHPALAVVQSKYKKAWALFLDN